MANPFTIGIAGGSGSGKSTVVRRVAEAVGDYVAVLEMDAYYKDQTNMPFEERVKVNYDHPFAFDVELFYLALKRNYDIKRVPVRLRVNETSSIHLARDGAAMVRDLGVMRLHQLLGHYQPVVPVHHHGDTTPRPFRLPRDTAPEERR